MKDSMMQGLKSLMNMKSILAYEVADRIGIFPSTLSVWFRKYDPDHYQKIMDAINQIEKERGETV